MAVGGAGTVGGWVSLECWGWFVGGSWCKFLLIYAILDMENPNLAMISGSSCCCWLPIFLSYDTFDAFFL